MIDGYARSGRCTLGPEEIDPGIGTHHGRRTGKRCIAKVLAGAVRNQAARIWRWRSIVDGCADEIGRYLGSAAERVIIVFDPNRVPAGIQKDRVRVRCRRINKTSSHYKHNKKKKNHSVVGYRTKYIATWGADIHGTRPTDGIAADGEPCAR